MMRLALMYMEGIGVPQDRVKGAMFVAQAADAGNAEAKAIIKGLESIK